LFRHPEIRGAIFGFTQPAGEKGEGSDNVNQTGWDPHDQPADLLIFQGS